MKELFVDDGLYHSILDNVNKSEESVSDYLRRMLLQAPSQAIPETEHELAEALADPRFLSLRAMVDRFLYILGTAHAQKKEDFKKVLASNSGRGRTYFATTKSAIEASGNSTQPKQIPGSNYWVVTCSNTREKRQKLRDVLKLLNYSDKAIKAAVSTVRLSNE